MRVNMSAVRAIRDRKESKFISGSVVGREREWSGVI